MQDTTARKAHFPGFDGARFLAASAVILAHVESLKDSVSLPSLASTPMFQQLGRGGVDLFFTLSGFLITYLLLEEKERTETVAVGKFYMRRVLRIWPLYFAVLIVAFAILPRIADVIVPGQPLADLLIASTGALRANFSRVILCYLFFLPNLVLATGPLVFAASHLWSIGMEEQFYLVWPWVVRQLKLQSPLPLIALFALHWAAGRAVRAQASALPLDAFWQLMGVYWTTFRIDYMIMGAIAAFALHRKYAFVMKYVINPVNQWLAVPLLVIMLSFGLYAFSIPMASTWGPVIYAVILLNMSVSPLRWANLNTPALSYLGKRSYGMYMLHPLAIYGAIYIVQRVGASPMFILFLSYAVTIALSILSYRYFEMPFLKLKERIATA